MKPLSSILKPAPQSSIFSSAYFDTSLLNLSTNVAEVINNSDCIIIVVPSAYAVDVLGRLPKNIFQNKKIISAIKGILPEQNLLTE